MIRHETPLCCRKALKKHYTTLCHSVPLCTIEIPIYSSGLSAHANERDFSQRVLEILTKHTILFGPPYTIEFPVILCVIRGAFFVFVLYASMRICVHYLKITQRNSKILREICENCCVACVL